MGQVIFWQHNQQDQQTQMLTTTLLTDNQWLADRQPMVGWGVQRSRAVTSALWLEQKWATLYLCPLAPRAWPCPPGSNKQAVQNLNIFIVPSKHLELVSIASWYHQFAVLGKHWQASQWLQDQACWGSLCGCACEQTSYAHMKMLKWLETAHTSPLVPTQDATASSISHTMLQVASLSSQHWPTQFCSEEFLPLPCMHSSNPADLHPSEENCCSVLFLNSKNRGHKLLTAQLTHMLGKGDLLITFLWKGLYNFVTDFF